jgi:DNA primase
MDIASEIKAVLSMSDVAEMYGFHPNRSGYICCPFHHEKTASMRIYTEPGRGFHCFGCGVGGSVIDFVMRLFGISFSEAIVRLNADFGLGLTNDKPDPKALEKYKQERREREQKHAKAEQELRAKIAEFRQLWWIIKTAEPFSDEWTDAVHKIDYLDWWIDQHLDLAKIRGD